MTISCPVAQPAEGAAVRGPDSPAHRYIRAGRRWPDLPPSAIT